MKIKAKITLFTSIFLVLMVVVITFFSVRNIQAQGEERVQNYKAEEINKVKTQLGAAEEELKYRKEQQANGRPHTWQDTQAERKVQSLQDTLADAEEELRRIGKWSNGR